MRITKQLMKETKERLRAKIAEVFNLTDEHLDELLLILNPAILPHGSREEKIHRALVWTVEDIIPDHLFQ